MNRLRIAAAFALGATIALAAVDATAQGKSAGGSSPKLPSKSTTNTKPSGLGSRAMPVLDRTSPPPLGAPPRLQLPDAQTVKLSNGLEIDLIETHKAPVVDITLVVGAGAVRDPADQPGLATFTAGMLDEGAGARTSLQIAEEIDFLGGSLSAGAGTEVAQVNLHVPRRGLAAGLEVFTDVVMHPTFPDSEIVRQRDLRKTGLLQLRDQPTAIAPLAFNAVVYGSGHPYGRPTNGTDASTDKLDRKGVVAFYEAYYRPGNARLLVVGDVTMSDLRGLLEPSLGAWEKRDVRPPDVPASPVAHSRAFYLVDKPGAPQSVVRIGNVGVPRSTPDYYPIQVMNTILGGSFTSRLNQNLREDKGYTYGASSGYEMRRLAGPFRAAASVHTDKTDSSVVEFLKELRRMRDEPVPAEELAKAKKYLTLGLPGEFETTAGAAQKFVELIANDLPLDTWNRYMAGIQAVTAEDVQRVAKATIDDAHLVMVIVGDREKIEPGLKALNEGPIVHRDLWGAEVTP